MGPPTRILVFTGNGKGKTTAALGMALRASGHGMRTLFIQFVKADPSTGEVHAVRGLPGVEIVQAGLGFLPPPTDAEFPAHCQAAERGLRLAREALASGRYDLVVLDEVCYAVARGLLREEQVIDAVRQAAPGCSVVLTGRDSPPGLIALADTATEMRCIKHALDSGRPAQKGIEI
jgi:cob(I)alamin adenosyltransferase